MSQTPQVHHVLVSDLVCQAASSVPNNMPGITGAFPQDGVDVGHHWLWRTAFQCIFQVLLARGCFLGPLGVQPSSESLSVMQPPDCVEDRSAWDVKVSSWVHFPELSSRWNICPNLFLQSCPFGNAYSWKYEVRKGFYAARVTWESLYLCLFWEGYQRFSYLTLLPLIVVVLL